MELSLCPAQPLDYERVREFYYDLIDAMQASEYHPKWQKGIYPTDDYLRSAIEAGELYMTLTDGKIIGAMVVNHRTGDGYALARWQIEAAENEVTVIHTLGVLPAYSRQGVGRYMVDQVIGMARGAGQKAIRLDVLVGNLPADRLYKGADFRYVGSVPLFYEDTGRCNFDLYEYLL